MSLQNYLKEQVAKKGYPDMDVYYSLGYCQGDGVSWRGAIYSAEAAFLATRVMEGRDLFRVLKAIHEGASIRIGHNSNHYYHANTMTVESDGIPSEIGDTITGPGGKRLSETDLQKEVLKVEKAWGCFSEAMLDDARSIAHDIEKQGYAIIDSMCYEEETVKEITTRNYRVEIQHTPDGGYLDYAENEELEQLVTANCKIACVTATVYEILDNGTEDEISSSSLGGVAFEDGGDNKYLREVWRQVAGNAISEARSVKPKPERRRNLLKIAA